MHLGVTTKGIFTLHRNKMKNTSYQIKDVPRKLQFKLLEKATNYFSEESKLGHGTFGQVYKGVLENGEEIAVKILKLVPQSDSQHFENEFGHLKRLRHENIVRLLGFCDESEPTIVQHGGRQVQCELIHRALCLEYMPTGSLTKLLSEEYTGTKWSIRYKIIKGICEGLKYLHEELEVPILHLDLKPDNILLDQDMVPKIADFGLSRLFGEENTIRTMSRQCTLGYCPPEFIDRGIISKKYDIFSLGVIIMKIIVGLEGYSSIADTDARGCFDYVYNNSRPNYAFVESDYKRVRCCIEIAINCMDKDRRKRPRISDVVSKLDEMDFFSSPQQHPVAKEAEGSTVAIHSQDEWNNQVDADKLQVVIDFPATWCSISRGMAPVAAAIGNRKRPPVDVQVNMIPSITGADASKLPAAMVSCGIILIASALTLIIFPGAVLVTWHGGAASYTYYAILVCTAVLGLVEVLFGFWLVPRDLERLGLVVKVPLTFVLALQFAGAFDLCAWLFGPA